MIVVYSNIGIFFIKVVFCVFKILDILDKIRRNEENSDDK